MKLKKLVSFVILALLVLLTVVLFIMRMNDAHAVNKKADLNEMAAAHEVVRRLEDGILKDGKYPEFYAGAYVDEGSNVIVCLTCDPSEARGMLDQYLSEIKEKYARVEFSLNRLRESKKMIEEIVGDGSSPVVVDVRANKVIVYLQEYDSDLVSRIYDRVCSRIVDFR
jgi:hypothetical protein